MVKKTARGPQGEPDPERDAGADLSLDLLHLEASQVPGPLGLRHRLLHRGHQEVQVLSRPKDEPSPQTIPEPLQSILTFLYLLGVPAEIVKNGSLEAKKRRKEKKRKEMRRKREKK